MSDRTHQLRLFALSMLENIWAIGTSSAAGILLA